MNDRPLDLKHLDHDLSSDYEGARAFHIESDWLFIHDKDGPVGTGTHSELFYPIRTRHQPHRHANLQAGQRRHLPGGLAAGAKWRLNGQWAAERLGQSAQTLAHKTPFFIAAYAIGTGARG